jgi:peptide/nickel transport system permease protein
VKDEKKGEKENSSKDEATTGQLELSEIAGQSQKLLRKLVRSSRATWKLYRSSATGMIGLGIAMSFFIMAAFASWIAPYDREFKAPSEDIFIADYETMDLWADKDWSTPMGLTERTREATLERILVYAGDGTYRAYPVDELNGIVLEEPINGTIPANVTYLEYAHFSYSFFFILEGSLLHEYNYDLSPRVDTTVDEYVEYQLPFEPTHHSNLWNGYSEVLNTQRLAIVFADDDQFYLMVKRPPYAPTGSPAMTYVSNLTLTDATIIGNPLVIDTLAYENGSMIILPTDIGLMAYKINMTRGGLGNIVQNATIGERMWVSNYSHEDEPFDVVVSENMITFPDPTIVTDEYQKTDVVVLGTQDGRLVAYDRENGSIAWAERLIMPNVRDYEITSVFPSSVGVLTVGESGERGFIAGVNPSTGLINYNGTQYADFDSHMNSYPYFISGQRTFLFSTDDNSIYLANELMKVNATFRAPGGGSKTPVSFVGNIYVSSIIGGNYFGVVTVDNKLFVESLQGRNIAPLPPGTYTSGNWYPLGTDYEGHDILSQLIYGTRPELAVGVTAAFFAVVIGTIVGLISGFYSGLIDDILMRITDVVLSLPGLVIILLFAAVFGPSLVNIIIIIAILSWAGIARVIRSVTMSLKERAFVDAAIVAGASDSRLIFRHIAPNVLPYAFLYMTFTISGAIVTEAILAFLGFGDVNHVTWGMMLQYLQISGHSLDAWWWLLPPGVAITMLSLSFYLIGRAFDEVVNPRLRKR